LRSRFTPYVGGGIGDAAGRRSRGDFTASDGARFISGGDHASEGFGLLEGGLSVAIAKHWSIVPAYRYVRYFRSGQDAAHIAKLGLRYIF
jgi:opacity protein-like surface antigen